MDARFSNLFFFEFQSAACCKKRIQKRCILTNVLPFLFWQSFINIQMRLQKSFCPIVSTTSIVAWVSGISVTWSLVQVKILGLIFLSMMNEKCANYFFVLFRDVEEAIHSNWSSLSHFYSVHFPHLLARKISDKNARA